MVTKKFLLPFAAFFVLYAVLDFGFESMMLYIMGGVIGATVKECFKVFGVEVGIAPIVLIWVALIVGVVALLYRAKNTAIKYAFLPVLATLMYVIDFLAIAIPYSFFDKLCKDVTFTSTVTIGLLVLIKSLIVTSIVFCESRYRIAL